MDGTIDPAGKDGVIECPHKNPLPAYLVERYAQCRISFGGDDNDLGIVT
jgi:hypothetical protein